MKELTTLKEITDKSTNTPDKLIAVLFNIPRPERKTIEDHLRWQWEVLEENHNVLFFKYVCQPDDEKWKQEFNIQRTPAFKFYHKGKEVDSLLDLEETLSTFVAAKQPDQNTPDEQTLKKKIKTVCEKYFPVQSNPTEQQSTEKVGQTQQQ